MDLEILYIKISNIIKKPFYAIQYAFNRLMRKDARKGFKVGDVVYVWDDVLNRVDKGVIVEVDDYIDRFTGKMIAGIHYKGENMERFASDDSCFYRDPNDVPPEFVE